MTKQPKCALVSCGWLNVLTLPFGDVLETQAFFLNSKQIPNLVKITAYVFYQIPTSLKKKKQKYKNTKQQQKNPNQTKQNRKNPVMTE